MSAVKDYRPNLGATIRKYRTRADFTLETLAERASLHPNFLGRVERGEEYISLTALRRIAKAVGIRVSNLVEDI